MTRPHRATAQSGFTLLEMSIILTAVMMVIGAYLSFYRPQQVTERTLETRQRIDRVLNAVSAFALIPANGNRLPCSAWPTSNPTNGNAKAAGCGGAVVDMGIVPYQTLGLSQDDAKDAFGNYMTYIVSGNATMNSGTAVDLVASQFCMTSPRSNIPLTRNGVVAADADRPYIAVISHGPEGIGGYDMQNVNPGSRNGVYGNMALLGTNESVNAVTGAVTDILYMDNYDPRPVTAAVTTHFDDIIGIMTGPQIASRLSLEGCH
ncbi:MAG TPA: hypothetical protein VGF14_06525 [Alphaproteobacteria bacterium]